MNYEIIVCEPGQEKPVCSFRGVQSETEPQIGEEREFWFDIIRKNSCQGKMYIKVRFVRKKKSIIFQTLPVANSNNEDVLHESCACWMYAEPVAKDYHAGLKRLKKYAEYVSKCKTKQFKKMHKI